MNSSPNSKISVATVVIPAAGGSRDVLGRNSDYPAALIRLGSKPIIFLTIEYLIEQGFRNFRIGVTSKYLPNFQNTLRILEKKARIEYIEGDSGENALGTIWKLVSELPQENPILINLGDTLCKWNSAIFEDSDCAILLEAVPDNERWSTANLSPESSIFAVFEKGSTVSGDFGICGVFWWATGKQLISSFPEDFAFGDITEILIPHIGATMRGVFPDVWCDSDHGDMRENSKHKILASRNFNKIEIDDFRGMIRKTSTNTEKLIKEIKYYKNLPQELRIFFPRMVQSSENIPQVFQDLEYYSYPTLSDIYCFEDAPRFVWKRILEKLSRITFQEFSQPHFKSEDLEIPLTEVFIEKSHRRNLHLAQESNPISQLLELSSLVINGELNFGVKDVLIRSSRVLKTINSPWTIIHGDYCLSNLLSDPDTNNIKLIDPRGGFDVPSCFGPQLYDVAKLGHSLVGRYDLIIADKFILDLGKLKNSEVELEILDSPRHLEIEEEYLSTYLAGQVDRNIAKLLSGLLLISIPGFHLEHPDRAIAMLVQGVKICNKALEEIL
jgi:hypothetical protein